MNRETILTLLMQYLDGFIFHPRLSEELVSALKGSGIESAFFAKLKTCLSILRTDGVLASKYLEIEPLGGGIYSMHVDGKGFNVRILFGVLSDGRSALLLGFFKRSGKKHTDYQSHIPPAVSRLNEMKELYENG